MPSTATTARPLTTSVWPMSRSARAFASGQPNAASASTASDTGGVPQDALRDRNKGARNAEGSRTVRPRDLEVFDQRFQEGRRR